MPVPRKTMMAGEPETDPRMHLTSLADMVHVFNAQIAVCSSPELQLDQKTALKIVEQMPEKLKPDFQNTLSTIVDVQGSPSCDVCQKKILTAEPYKITASTDFERDLTQTPEFQNYLKKHYAEFQAQAKTRHQTFDVDQLEREVRLLAKYGFAVHNSQWNSHWRGKVSGGLTMGLSMTRPTNIPSLSELKKLGMGSICDDSSQEIRVIIGTVIQGGPVTQQEHREIAEIADDVVFDLRRRGNAWADNARILLVSFPDVQTFLRSLAGECNLRRTQKFDMRQRDKLTYGGDTFQMPLAWEAVSCCQPIVKGADLSPGKTRSLLNASIESCMAATVDVSSDLVCLSAMRGDAGGLRKLVRDGAIIGAAEDKSATTALSHAASQGFADVMQSLLECLPAEDIESYANRQNSQGKAALHFAAAQGHAYCASLLIYARADVDLSDSAGQTPATLASQKDHVNCLEVLLEARADISKPTNSGSSPALVAACDGRVHVLDRLLQARADANASDKRGSTPTFVASENGYAEAVKALLHAGANINAANSNGATATFIAS